MTSAEIVSSISAAEVRDLNDRIIEERRHGRRVIASKLPKTDVALVSARRKVAI
jgi:hypothetical protein